MLSSAIPWAATAAIYLRGRYEVQIEDNYGDEPDSHKIGGIYGFLTPINNAAKEAGEWQTLGDDAGWAAP